MVELVRELAGIDRGEVARVGGKAASLAALTALEGVRVPAGVVVTTEAHRQVVLGDAEVVALRDRLDAGEPVAGDLRRRILALPMPEVLLEDLRVAVARLGGGVPLAVRSSATAEDLATASFAGQHDSVLGVVGLDAVADAVRTCWASLFSDRAVAYRQRQGMEHRAVAMAVVIQQQVGARASGVLFTADPVSGHRKVAVVEAVRGLGEALVSGLVAPDRFRLRDERPVERELQDPAAPVLTDEEVAAVVRCGRRVAEAFGSPQDIEWCLDEDGPVLVQSRAITTLFPIPDAGDDQPHLYLSVGHQQMMTDALTPLGLDVRQHNAMVPMFTAAGRQFVDVAPRLANPAMRGPMVAMMRQADPLMGDALATVLERGDLLPEPPAEGAPLGPSAGAPTGPPAAAPVEPDPALVARLVAECEAAGVERAARFEVLSGPAVVDAVVEDLADLRAWLARPDNQQAILGGMNASTWLDQHLAEWLGEDHVADVLTLSAPGNITSQMGLDLLDVADVVRRHPAVVAYLRADPGDDFVAQLAELDGGAEVQAALEAYLERYGMRCIGEIDLARPRWREQPTALLPALLTNVAHAAPGEAARRLAEGEQRAAAKEAEVLQRLRARPDGDADALETERQIRLVRTFIGYREYPKYEIVSRFFVYKQALWREAAGLVAEGALDAVEDVAFLELAEVAEALRTRTVPEGVVAARREAFRWWTTLTPPRVLTSEGEAIHGSYHRGDLPEGALAGLGVSPGVVEGRARVVTELGEAELAPGDILVTPFTDPSWAPLFVAIGGLVTEVGGLMTHGAVVAREYGLPTVVGVEAATTRIADGQRIRLDSGRGIVELLS